MRKVVELKEFDEFEIGKNKIPISHLQFADDTVFLGEASLKNVRCLRGILRLFEMVSGLKVNFHKSSIHAINLENQQVEVLRCKIGKITYSYFGPSN